MPVPEHLIPFLTGAAESLVALLVIWGGIRLVDRLFPEGVGEDEHHHRFKRQVIKVLITAFGVVALLIVLPVSSDTRGQLFGLLGIVVTAIIALSSTSFVSNAMAGIMLRSVSNFRPGDFIQVGEHFGRVTDRGLFHTEIQTETRDLTTLPNLFLVQQPVTVTRSSGTIVSASVSLGYDVPHEKAKTKLMEATQEAELEDGFVRVADLMDHAVLYKVYGLLNDPKKLLFARSQLREKILSVLHGADIEITSPSHVFRRNMGDETRAIPLKVVEPQASGTEEAGKEEIIFDKAEEAEKTETLRERRDQYKEELKDLKKNGDGQSAKSKAEDLQNRIEHLEKLLARRAEQKKEER